MISSNPNVVTLGDHTIPKVDLEGMVSMLSQPVAVPNNPTKLLGVWKTWKIQPRPKVCAYAITNAHDPQITLAKVLVSITGKTVMVMPDEDGRLQEYTDLIHGLGIVLELAFYFKWTYVDLKVGDDLLSNSWLCAHVHHHLRVVNIPCKDLAHQLLGVYQDLNSSRVSSLEVSNNLVVPAWSLGWVPDAKLAGRPAKHRNLSV